MLLSIVETYSEPCQTSKMEIFVKIVNSFLKALHIAAYCKQNDVK